MNTSGLLLVDVLKKSGLLISCLPSYGLNSLGSFLIDVAQGMVSGPSGPLNLLGLTPPLAGNAGSLWTIALHFAGSGLGLEWELAKSFMLSHNPYAFSGHPMYFFELTFLFGWVLFYGSKFWRGLSPIQRQGSPMDRKTASLISPAG